MAKTNLTLPNGTKILMEGSAEELAILLEKMSSSESNIRAKVKRVNKSKKKASGNKKQSFSINKNINLRGNDKIKSFNDFVLEKKPSSAIVFNTISVYYLKQMMNVDKVSINEIYTCYKDADRKPPDDLVQSIRDTSSTKYGYLDSADMNNITIPHRGISFVEYDLPKDKKSTTK